MYLHIYCLGHYHYQGWEYAGVDIDEEEEDMENDAEEEEEQEAEGEVNQVSTLTFTILWANSADNKFTVFFLFFQKISFCILCKSSPKECICMTCQPVKASFLKK